ncbi:hypothetical protein OX283_012685 [Flavobacterium sp. SUN052]|uniref:hypothetical protein n=1 Tax=Flavobacterium sp. SUN052 TaxID=3002441 RepID=UPI00237E767D|nr:hypothetical protein [Flavobacterium sp. SUN052]MEC4005519.1 hypothetical protein [Flavobacterium sp. SUN052]
MNKNYLNENQSPSILTIGEVANRLKLKKTESATIWLNQNGVTIHKLNKKSNMVYEIDFSCALLIPFVKDFIKKHPMSWMELLKSILCNDAVYNMILLKIDDNSLASKKPKTKVNPKTAKEIELRNKLLS